MEERHSVRNEKQLEVHGTMSQVVFSPEVGDLLGLHGLQLWTVCDTMTQTTTERTAPLSWKQEKQVCQTHSQRGTCRMCTHKHS